MTFFNKDVLPSLVQSGFERDIAENIFKISASAWKLMGLASKSKNQFSPGFGQTYTRNTSRHNIKPRTWIIHPRAHSFLTKGDSLCLIVYLQHLGKETNPVLKKILARLLIEFIGNYSLKFIDSTLPENKVIDAVFYGYVTMFWKNLQTAASGSGGLAHFQALSFLGKNLPEKTDPKRA